MLHICIRTVKEYMMSQHECGKNASRAYMIFFLYTATYKRAGGRWINNDVFCIRTENTHTFSDGYDAYHKCVSRLFKWTLNEHDDVRSFLYWMFSCGAGVCFLLARVRGERDYCKRRYMFIESFAHTKLFLSNIRLK